MPACRRGEQPPITGRPILFVDPMHTHGFEGMEREKARPDLPAFLFAAAMPLLAGLDDCGHHGLTADRGVGLRVPASRGEPP
jgi:hypothetical protein